MLKHQSYIKSGGVSLDRKAGVTFDRKGGVYFTEISTYLKSFGCTIVETHFGFFVR